MSFTRSHVVLSSSEAVLHAIAVQDAEWRAIEDGTYGVDFPAPR